MIRFDFVPTTTSSGQTILIFVELELQNANSIYLIVLDMFLFEEQIKSLKRQLT